MKRIIILIGLLAVLLIPSSGWAQEPQFEVNTNPLSLLFGAFNVEGMYFVTPKIAPGLYYWQWTYSNIGFDYKITMIQPFVNYYFKPKRNFWFARGGFMNLKIETNGASGSMSGPTAGGGYRWKFKKQSMTAHAGYELAFVSSVEVGGTTFSGFVGTLGYFRVGYQF